jgi:pimeloyl-ACP methyl ester carboxylesterase
MNRPTTTHFCLAVSITIFILFGAFDSFAETGRQLGLYYETKSSGEAVVFIHGGQMDRRMWDGQYDRFAKRYRVIR